MKAQLLAALAAAVEFVRKLPIAKYLRPVWQGALTEAVQRCGDELQSRADLMLEQQGLDALPKIHGLIDGAQEKFAALVRGLSCLPKGAEEHAIAEVNRAVDGLQARLTAAVAQQSVGAAQAAFDAAFDRFQEELQARIAAL